MKFLTLTMIVRENVTRNDQVQSNEPTGEDDGMDDAPATPQDDRPTETREIAETKPLTVNLDQIRNFYPRKNQMPGSRVILKSGTAYVVKETHDEILAKLQDAA